MTAVLKILVVLLALYFLYQGARFVYLLGKSFEISSQARVFTAMATQGAKRILIAGDSTAVGTGVSDPEDSIAGRLAHDFPEVHIDNIGQNGFTVGQTFASLQNSHEHYDLILIQVGGNNVLQLTSHDELVKEADMLLQKAKQLSKTVMLMPSGNVGLAPIFPRVMGEFFTARTRKVRAVLLQAAEKASITYIDLFAERGHDPLLENPKKNFSADLLHPSSIGYGIWYEELRAQDGDALGAVR